LRYGSQFNYRTFTDRGHSDHFQHLEQAHSRRTRRQKKRIADSLELVSEKKFRKVQPSGNGNQQINAATADTNTSVALTDSSISPDSVQAILRMNQFGAFADAAAGEEKFYTLENDLLKITFTNKGGRVYSAELKNYKTFDQKPLLLFESDSTRFGLNFFRAEQRHLHQ
jgi:hypothetical protein